jgi:hypothetical protein
LSSLIWFINCIFNIFTIHAIKTMSGDAFIMGVKWSAAPNAIPQRYIPATRGNVSAGAPDGLSSKILSQF